MYSSGLITCTLSRRSMKRPCHELKEDLARHRLFLDRVSRPWKGPVLLCYVELTTTQRSINKEIAMSIGRICVSAVTLVTPQDSVQKAAERMHEHKVGTLVILNELRQPIGVLTDRDIVTRVVALGKDPVKTLVGEVM